MRLIIYMMLLVFSVTSGFCANEQSFKSLAKSHNIDFATAITPAHLKRDPKYYEIFTREFDVAFPENSFKMRSLQPRQNLFNFEAADKLVTFAQEHSIDLYGHTLIWGNPKSLPDWIKNNDWTRDELIQVLEKHVTTIVTHFKGKVKGWDVVNEAFCYKKRERKCITKGNEPAGMDDSIWRRIIGPEFIEIALRAARRADPDAILYINENSNELIETPKADKYYEFVKMLKDNNVPLDGVGFQMHIAADKIHRFKDPYTRLSNNFKRFNDLGLRVHVTELDVRLVKRGKLPTHEQLSQQANIYNNILKACLDAKNCPVFNMWGFTDKYSWIRGKKPGYDFATIMDDNIEPKPAYYTLKKTLSSHNSRQ